MFETLSNKGVGMGLAGLANLATLLAQTPGVKPEVSWYNTGWFMFVLLVVLVSLSIFLGRVISKALRLSDYSGKLALIFGCIFIATLVVATKWPPKFGIDLRGGINLVGSLNLDALESEAQQFGKKTQAKDIVPILVRRVDPSGTREIMILRWVRTRSKSPSRPTVWPKPMRFGTGWLRRGNFNSGLWPSHDFSGTRPF